MYSSWVRDCRDILSPRTTWLDSFQAARVPVCTDGGSWASVGFVPDWLLLADVLGLAILLHAHAKRISVRRPHERELL